MWDGIVGKNEGGRIENCTNSAVVQNSGGYATGGVVGCSVNNANVKNCANLGEIRGVMYTGGICGTIEEGAIITESYNLGKVSGNDETGGIAGRCHVGTIQKCYNEGTISGPSKVGGILGDNLGPENGDFGENTNTIVENCWNSGTIIGDGDYVGGIIGQQTGNDNAKLTKCYSIGVITSGGSYTGGVVGSLETGSVSGCWYLEGTATGGIGGSDVAGQAEFRTSTYMKSSAFIQELGEANWKLIESMNDGYPILAWQ